MLRSTRDEIGPLAEDVGVYAADGHGAEPQHLSLDRVHSGRQRITVTVPREPVRAGIDPRHLLIDVTIDDNVADVRRPE